MIKLVQEIDIVARDDPITGLKNPAAAYYDAADDDDVFDTNRPALVLNDGEYAPFGQRQNFPLEIIVIAWYQNRK